MRDGMVENLLKSAPSHILKSHVFAFVVSVFVVINSLVRQALDLTFFSEEFVGFVVQSYRHLNPGSVSLFGGLSF